MTAPAATVTDDTRRTMLTTMIRIAACDEVLRQAIHAGQVTVSYYSPRGQEGVAAGFAAALRPGDRLVTTYRGLHDQIAMGVPLRPLLAEMLGRATGTGKGKGGPMHIAWPEAGVMVTTGVVGSGLPIATGIAWADQYVSNDAVTVVCFGDGASNIGAFHEACNLASVWDLPVVFLCQNNGYGEHTAFAHHQRTPHVATRAAAYAMPGVTVDGNDPDAVHAAVASAVARARAGGGPSLVEAVTYRLYGHVVGDAMAYVDPEELRVAWEHEPLRRYRTRLLDEGVLDEAEVTAVEADAARDAAAVLADVLADPEPGSDELLTDVVADGRVERVPGGTATPPSVPAAPRASPGAAAPSERPGPVSVRAAITRALGEALASDDRVVLLGEDIADPDGGVFGVTRGLSSRFGAERVRNTPISEQAIVGAAVGAAVAGLRPVAEVMFMDFLAVCLDQLANHAAKLRYMSGGRTWVPLVVRTAVGGGLGVGAQHSQMLEAWLTHVPGLKVVVPSTPSDARALLTSCIEDDDPCVFIEQVPLLSYRDELLDRHVPLGAADVKRTGRDVTVVTYGRQVHDALAVADRFAADGVEVEVLDLRSLAPLDEEALFRSVARTRRAVIFHEAVVVGGFGAELAARLGEELTGDLAAPVRRVGAVAAPTPYASGLERLALPGREALAAAVSGVLDASR